MRDEWGTHVITKLFRWERVHFVQDARAFQHGLAYDLQALRAEFIDCILRRVPEDVVVTVVEVDQIDAGNAPFDEREMIVVHG